MKVKPPVLPKVKPPASASTEFNAMTTPQRLTTPGGLVQRGSYLKKKP